MMSEERLQKLIARSGLCSRREADRLVEEGRVTVNGRVAKVGDRADPGHDHVKIDGKRLRAPETLRYILLYKPREIMTTCDDPEERSTVVDLVRPTVKERVFPVGRLDYNSEGLIVLTNDGELAERLGHPRFGVIREYMVKIRGDLTDAENRKFMRGTMVGGHHVRPLRARRERATKGGGNTWWRVAVTEGRTHEVRELFYRAGHPVQRLRRVAIGPIRDDEIRPGEYRFLTDREIDEIRKVTDKRGSKRTTGGARKSRSPSGKRNGRRKA